MLKFYRVEQKGLTVAHLIQWSNGLISVKFNDHRFPNTYEDLEALIDDLDDTHIIVEEGEFNDD